MENGYVESFSGRFRDECLNENWFCSTNFRVQFYWGALQISLLAAASQQPGLKDPTI